MAVGQWHSRSPSPSSGFPGVSAKPAILLDADQPATTIYVRYIDVNGAPQGPFPIRFDPIGALEREQRKILEMTAGSWLSFREYNGLLLYYTHLMSYRCA